jgi:hypothetical protein
LKGEAKGDVGLDFGSAVDTNKQKNMTLRV